MWCWWPSWISNQHKHVNFVHNYTKNKLAKFSFKWFSVFKEGFYNIFPKESYVFNIKSIQKCKLYKGQFNDIYVQFMFHSFSLNSNICQNRSNFHNSQKIQKIRYSLKMYMYVNPKIINMKDKKQLPWSFKPCDVKKNLDIHIIRWYVL